MYTPLLSAAEVVHSAVTFSGEVCPLADLSALISPSHEEYFVSKHRLQYTRNVLRTIICIAFMEKYPSYMLASTRQKYYMYVRYMWNLTLADYDALIQDAAKLLKSYSKKRFPWLCCCK